MASEISKIYRLEAIGGQKLVEELREINKQFKEIRKTKQDLNGERTQVEDPAKLKEIADKLEALRLKEKELAVELKEKQIQLKAEQLLQKQLSVQRQQELNEKRQQQAGNTALAGSYNDIAKKYRELLAATKNGTDLGNPEEIARATSELKKYKDQLDAFNRSLSRDGTLVGEYTSGIVEAFKRLGAGDLIKDKIDRDRDAVKKLDQDFEDLKKQLSDIRVTGTGSLEAIEADMVANRQEAGRLEQQLNEINAALARQSGIGGQVVAGLRDEFKNAGKELRQFVVSYLGFQALLTGGREAIRINADLSDSFADLKRILDATDDEMASLNAEFREMDTRTAVEELVSYATIAAKAGVATKDIVGVTKAIDDLQLVAGKELGDVEQTVTSLVKLVNVFEGPGKATPENISRYGNALVDLANKGVASGGYLVDFAQRLAGIEGISKIQIQSVLGMAAAFEETGQSAEVASTAVTQVIMKMGQDVPKFAAMAKMTEEAFASLLRSSPAEALIRVAESAKGDSVAIDEISKNFAELEVKGVRVAGTLGVLADKSDFFREKIGIAGAALQDTTAITEGAEAKQKTFGATIDRVNRAIQNVGSNKVVNITLQALAAVLLLVINNLGLLIAALTVYATIQGIANAAAIRAAVIKRANNLLYQAEYAWLVLTVTWNRAYALALTLVTGAAGRATTAITLFNTVIRVSPLGIFLGVLALVAAATVAFAGATNGSTEKLREHARQLQINAEISRKAAEATAEETSQMLVNVRIAGDLKNSYETRRAALSNLIAKYPAFSKALRGEEIDVRALALAYKEVAGNILSVARAKAAAGLAAEKMKDITTAQTLLQRIETETGIQNPGRNGRQFISVSGLSEADRKQLLGGFFGTDLSNNTSVRADGKGGITFLAKDLDEIRKFLGGVVADKTRIYNDYANASANADKVVADQEAKSAKATAATIDAKAKEGTATVGELEARIQQLGEQRKRLTVGSKELAKNIEDTKALQKQLDDANGKEGPKERPYAGARIGGEDKDRLGIIDAQRDSELTAESLRIAQLRQLRATSEDEEVAHLEKLQKIREDAADKKLQLLNSGNAAEQKKAGEVKLDRIKTAQETEDAIYKIRSEGLERIRTEAFEKAADKRAGVDENPDATAADKAKAASVYYGEVIAAQKAFNADMDALEKQLALKSRNNANARIKELGKLNRDGAKATREDLLAEMNQAIAEEEALYQQRTVASMENLGRKLEEIANGPGKLEERKRRIQEVQAAYNKTFLEEELKHIDQELALLDKRILGEEEFNKRYLALVRRRMQAEEGLRNQQLDDEQKQQARRNAYRELGFNIAEKISGGYFESQQREIESDNEKTRTALQNEKERRLSLAQTASERATIEEEFARREAQIEKQRAQQRKELARKQMIVEYALASIKAFSTAATAFDGWMRFAELTAAFGTGMVLLQSQTFEKGGQLGSVLRGGGRFQGPSHTGGGIKFFFRGQPTETEGEEGYVINKTSMRSGRRMTVSGTPAQIASAANVAGGGVNFAPGATARYFAMGGALGVSLRPPVYVASGSGGYNSGNTELAALILEQQAQLHRQQQQLSIQQQQMSLLKVAVPVQQVTQVQENVKKANAIGTL